MRMNELQELLYNEGERLIPYVSHNEEELVRHRSSYAFFHKVISIDLQNGPKKKGDVKIVDLGFGTGYGAALLCSIPNSKVTGVDIAPECETFAKRYYPRQNVDYVIEDLSTYVPKMAAFDYAVSRGVLEHVPDGLNLTQQIPCKKRVMIDVPYKEKPGNDHHVLTGITEADFASLQNCELFYEDLQGNIYDATDFPPDANMIMAVMSDPSLPKIKDILKFPIAAVTSNELEVLSEATLQGSEFQFSSSESLMNEIGHFIKETDVVADIGCGICPMNFFRPKLHIMVEPWQEYSDILTHRHADDKSVIILRLNALDALKSLATNSVDSVFLIDVIEHIEKDEGFKIIQECERVARQQVVIFTPLGFMPQTVEKGEKDGWGLSCGQMQDHLSGWMPEDFSKEWTFYICKDFHKIDHRNQPLQKPHGAFFAIRNFSEKANVAPKTMTDLRRQLPSEIALELAQAKIAELDHAKLAELEQAKLALEQAKIVELESELATVKALLHQREMHFCMRAKRVANRFLKSNDKAA
jgi:2-polyprenyl-3-methyl-5-hydroxy-6-metoxy-1,4-benzoquinol methylase